jgi:hypothetical protein
MDYISETKKLARKWVYKLEWGLDPDKLFCPEAWDAILTEDNKNPLYWSEAECEEFLYCLVGLPYIPSHKKKALTPLEGKDFPTL